MNGQIPFEGDSYIALELVKLRAKFNIECCIETGTQYGSTTESLNDIFKKVITIEADPEYFEYSNKRLEGKGITVVYGKSEEALKELSQDNCLYYLDAHGCNIGGCPLKNELQIIGGKKYKNVLIAIHDFKVPDKDFGFDAYDYELKFEEIESYLHIIYPDGFGYYYNDVADGAYRGIIYIYPKEL